MNSGSLEIYKVRMSSRAARKIFYAILFRMKNERGFIKIILAIIVLFLAAGTIYAMRKVAPPADEHMIQPDDVSRARAWVITDLGIDEKTGMPKTQVGLIANGKEHDIGTFGGSCKQQVSDPLPNEKEKVVCWFAGGGQEIGLFDEGGRTVVKVGDVDEGSAETEGFRGNFHTELTL